MPSDGQRDIGGMAVAAVMIVIGLVFLWDTTNLVDSDSVVFPRTVIFGMILFSIMFIVWNFLRPSGADTEGVQGGSTPRRIGLVAAMLGCAFLMPYTGFLLSGLAAPLDLVAGRVGLLIFAAVLFGGAIALTRRTTHIATQ